MEIGEESRLKEKTSKIVLIVYVIKILSKLMKIPQNLLLEICF